MAEKCGRAAEPVFDTQQHRKGEKLVNRRFLVAKFRGADNEKRKIFKHKKRNEGGRNQKLEKNG